MAAKFCALQAASCECHLLQAACCDCHLLPSQKVASDIEKGNCF